MAIFLLLVQILVGIIVFFTAFIIGFSLYILYIRRQYAHIPQPKTTSFFGGHLGILTLGNDDSFKTVELWIKTFGNVICLHTYHVSRIVVYDPAIVKEVLMNTELRKPRYYWFENLFGERFLGRGILTETDHQVWSLKRTRLNKAFHKSSLKQMIGQFDSCASDFINHLKPLADGKQVIHMVDKFVLVTEDIIAKVGFGLHLGIYVEDGLNFDQAVSDTFRMRWIHVMPQWFSYPPFGKGLKQRKTTTSACRMIRKLGRDCILKRLDDLENKRETPIDLLHYILQEYMMDDALFSGNLFENIIDEFVTFFIAGNETTSTLLSFTLLLLGKHPDVQKKVQMEIDDVIGGKQNIDYQDVLKLKYLSMVFKEVLRIHPPVHSAIRVASSEMLVDDFKCPKGTMIQCHHAHISKLEKFYKNPFAFCPERWVDNSNADNINFNYQYFPFSAGPRTCIGKEFALIEARILMTRIMENFNIRLEEQSYNYATVGGTTRPADGCKVTLTIR